MKITIIKCGVFSFSVFLLTHIVATLGYLNTVNSDFSLVLIIGLLVAALPAYYFVKRHEERLFVYPLIMTAFAAFFFGVFWLAFNILVDKNVIQGWEILIFLFAWLALAYYFALVIGIDLIIATVSYIKKRMK